MVSVGIASTLVLTEETRSPALVGLAPTPETRLETMLAIAEGTSRTSDRTEEMGRRSGRDVAAVLSGKSVADVLSKIAVAVGTSISLVSVAWTGLRDAVGPSDSGSLAVLMAIEDWIGTSSDTAVVSAFSEDEGMSVGKSSSTLEEIGSSVVAGSVVVAG